MPDEISPRCGIIKNSTTFKLLGVLPGVPYEYTFHNSAGIMLAQGTVNPADNTVFIDRALLGGKDDYVLSISIGSSSSCFSLAAVRHTYSTFYDGEIQPEFCDGSGSNKSLIQNEMKITVVPNPGSGVISVQVDDEEKPMRFELFDLTGKMIYSGSDREIDFSGEPNGIYYLKAISAAGVATERIIKQ